MSIRVGVFGVAAMLLLSTQPLQAGDPFAGEEIYRKHCESCHGEDGSGREMGILDFRRGEGLMQVDYQIVETLKNGLGLMPAYFGILSDEELEDAITYTRTLR